MGIFSLSSVHCVCVCVFRQQRRKSASRRFAAQRKILKNLDSLDSSTRSKPLDSSFVCPAPDIRQVRRQKRQDVR